MWRSSNNGDLGSGQLRFGVLRECFTSFSLLGAKLVLLLRYLSLESEIYYAGTNKEGS